MTMTDTARVMRDPMTQQFDLHIIPSDVSHYLESEYGYLELEDTVSITVIDPTPTKSITIDVTVKPAKPPRKRHYEPVPAGAHVAMQTEWVKYPDVTMKSSGLPTRRLSIKQRFMVTVAYSTAMAVTALAGYAAAVLFR